MFHRKSHRISVESNCPGRVFISESALQMNLIYFVKGGYSSDLKRYIYPRNNILSVLIWFSKPIAWTAYTSGTTAF